MKGISIGALFLLFLITLCSRVYAETQLWEVAEQYGDITAAKLQKAINNAVDYRKRNPNDTIILNLAKGRYTLEKEVTVANLNSQGNGWLIIKGQGIGVTELVDSEYSDPAAVTFRVNAPHRLKLCDFSLTGSRLTASQGTVAAVGNEHVDIEIDSGFPLPTELFETETSKANKLRLMDDSDPKRPHYVEGLSNDHYSNRIAWLGSDEGMPPKKLHGRVWRFFIKLQKNQKLPYKVGNRLAISSKSNRSNWGAFNGGGRDVVFENIELHCLGRIKFRHQKAATWNNVRFTNVSIIPIEIDGITQFYSTDAGPQIGHDQDGGSISNLVMENCVFRNTTDDGSAFQRVASGRISNNRWENCGGVLIGINCRNNLVVSNNIYYHCPLEDNRPDGTHYKGAYDFSADRNQNKRGSVTLCWKAGPLAQQHDIYFGTTVPPPMIKRQNELNFTTGELQPGTTYYWRVNEYNNQFGINEGDIQSFRF